MTAPANPTPGTAEMIDLMVATFATNYNDRAFDGYLIWRQMLVFIVGRAELYGEKFTMAYYNALDLKDVSNFLGLLKDYDIDGLLLQPGTPAAGLLDHLGNWRKVHADDVAILYARSGG